jgi:hypothetical protein
MFNGTASLGISKRAGASVTERVTLSDYNFTNVNRLDYLGAGSHPLVQTRTKAGIGQPQQTLKSVAPSTGMDWSPNKLLLKLAHIKASFQECFDLPNVMG